jgi:predicted metal-binding protein/SAM-dependent methyltransferase
VAASPIDPARRADPAQGSFQLLEDLASASWLSEALFAALELDLFARLGRRERSAAELAGDQGWDCQALERLLDALVEMGLLVKWEGRFANGPLATRHLLPESPDYLGDFLAYRRYIATHWQRLPDRVRRGPEANRRGEGESAQAYAERVLAYVRALDAQARLKAREAMAALVLLLEPPARILDLGGGAGAWCRAALHEWPGAQALLFDLPEVIAAAQRIHPAPRDWQGIKTMAGDCRSPQLPAGSFDLIVVSNLLHAYGEAEAQGILGQAAGLLAPGGTLLIHDYFCEEQAGHALKGRLYDLHMLLNTYNGRIHGLERLAALLGEAGLGRWRMLKLDSDSAMIMAQAGEASPGQVTGDDLLILQARQSGFERAAIIKTGDVAVEPWVVQKCRAGCPEYGRWLQCPPHSLDHEGMRDLLGSYQRALLLQGAPPGKQFHQKLLALERSCFLAGFHQALALGAGPCTVCEQCDVTQPCRFPGRARPAMEACGVDVYATVRRAGWQLEPVRERDGWVKFFGLVLLD